MHGECKSLLCYSKGGYLSLLNSLWFFISILFSMLYSMMDVFGHVLIWHVILVIIYLSDFESDKNYNLLTNTTFGCLLIR